MIQTFARPDKVQHAYVIGQITTREYYDLMLLWTFYFAIHTGRKQLIEIIFGGIKTPMLPSRN